MLNRFSVGVCLVVISFKLISQVSILNSTFNAFNVSSDALLYANIMNMDGEKEVYLIAKIYNGLNQPILTVNSTTIRIKNGLNNTAQLGIKSNSSEFSGGNDAQYIKFTHQLPSGKFRYCLFLKSIDNIEGDDLCEEYENESNSFLFLASPADKDTIESKNPILVWNHSDLFTLSQQGEMYRLIIVDLKHDQSADAGINVNSPILQSNFLTRHDIQYPFDAPKLEDGKRYGWQVQKIINNVVVNKTEAWEFILSPKFEEKYNKYIEIKANYNSGTYVALGNKIFFTFNQEYYTSNQHLNLSITPEHQAALKNVKAKEDKNLSQKINTKEVGHNQYEIDLNELKIESGFYYLKIKDEKGQQFQLKFYVK